MNLKFLNNCFDLIALQTCIFKNIDEKESFSTQDLISITNELNAIVTYKCIWGDYRIHDGFDIHEFEIKFFRNEKFLDELKFSCPVKTGTVNEEPLISTKLSAKDKLNYLKFLKFKVLEKLELLRKKVTLNMEEIEAINIKANELRTNSLEMVENTNKKR